MAPWLLRISYVASVRTPVHSIDSSKPVSWFQSLRLHILCFFHPVSAVLAYTSSLLASTSFLTGMLLIHRHEQLEGAEAHEAVRYSLFDCKISFPYSFLQQAYLSGVRSEYFKFQGVAAAYSLPRVLSLVGLITFFSQWFVLIWEITLTSALSLWYSSFSDSSCLYSR